MESSRQRRLVDMTSFAIGNMCSSPIIDPATCVTAGSVYGYTYAGSASSTAFPAGCFLYSSTEVAWNTITTYITSSAAYEGMCIDLSTYDVYLLDSGRCTTFLGEDGRTLDYIGGQDLADLIASLFDSSATTTLINDAHPTGGSYYPSSPAFYFNTYLLGQWTSGSFTPARINFCYADNVYNVAASSAGTLCSNAVLDITDCITATRNMAMDYAGSLSSSLFPAGCFLFTATSPWTIAFNTMSSSTAQCSTGNYFHCICRRFPPSTLAACPAGSWIGTTASCTPCAAGRYSSSTGSVSCAPCAPGNYGAEIGLTSCASCPAGSYCPTTSLSAPTSCPPGSFCQVSSLTAVSGACAAGQYSVSTASECTLCAYGSFQPSTGQGVCEVCFIFTVCRAEVT